MHLSTTNARLCCDQLLRWCATQAFTSIPSVGTDYLVDVLPRPSLGTGQDVMVAASVLNRWRLSPASSHTSSHSCNWSSSSYDHILGIRWIRKYKHVGIGRGLPCLIDKVKERVEEKKQLNYFILLAFLKTRVVFSRIHWMRLTGTIESFLAVLGTPCKKSAFACTNVEA